MVCMAVVSAAVVQVPEPLLRVTLLQSVPATESEKVTVPDGDTPVPPLKVPVAGVKVKLKVLFVVKTMLFPAVPVVLEVRLITVSVPGLGSTAVTLGSAALW